MRIYTRIPKGSVLNIEDPADINASKNRRKHSLEYMWEYQRMQSLNIVGPADIDASKEGYIIIRNVCDNTEERSH